MATNSFDMGADDGKVAAKIAGHEVVLDLWAVYHSLIELVGKHQGSPHGALHSDVVDLLTQLGYPPVSRRMAERFMEKIFSLVNELKKGGGDGETSAPSPDSTGSGPAA